jgi:hypothetical protein
LASDEDGLFFEVWARVEEVLGDENGCGSSVRRGAALQFCEGLVNHGRIHDLFESIDIFELGVGISLGVLVVDAGDFGEVFIFGSISMFLLAQEGMVGGKGGRVNALLHVFPSSIPKHLCCTRRIRYTSRNPHHLTSSTRRITSIIPEALERPRHHLLEPHNHNTIRTSMGDNIAGQMQTSGARTAVVVHVINWDLGHAELVKDSLATGGVAVAVACDALVDIVVVDLGVKQGFDACFEAELSVVDFASWLNEFGHAYAEDVAWFVAFDNHFGSVVNKD